LYTFALKSFNISCDISALYGVRGEPMMTFILLTSESILKLSLQILVMSILGNFSLNFIFGAMVASDFNINLIIYIYIEKTTTTKLQQQLLLQ